jgi:hypothetical protein
MVREMMGIDVSVIRLEMNLLNDKIKKLGEHL